MFRIIKQLAIMVDGVIICPVMLGLIELLDIETSLFDE
ncbi:Uncharacterised protein [Citrobacter youngae]|nr:Uncharacterised protein [Citrobacter youngae]